MNGLTVANHRPMPVAMMKAPSVTPTARKYLVCKAGIMRGAASRTASPAEQQRRGGPADGRAGQKLLKALPDANWARKQVADTEGPKMKEFVAKGGFVHQLTEAQREPWAAVIRPGQAEMVQAIGGKAQEVMAALNNGKKAWAEKFGKK